MGARSEARAQAVRSSRGRADGAGTPVRRHGCGPGPAHTRRPFWARTQPCFSGSTFRAPRPPPSAPEAAPHGPSPQQPGLGLAVGPGPWQPWQEIRGQEGGTQSSVPGPSPRSQGLEDVREDKHCSAVARNRCAPQPWTRRAAWRKPTRCTIPSVGKVPNRQLHGGRKGWGVWGSVGSTG